MARIRLLLGSALLLMAVVGVVFFAPVTNRWTEHITVETISPFARAWAGIRERWGDFRQSLRQYDALEEENRNLRAENVRLQAEIRQMDYLRTENDRFREMLAFRDQQSYRLLACRVVERDPSNWWNSVLVDRGWKDDPNLAPDQPVLTPRGVVGKTGTVGRSTTRVMLISDENCKVSVLAEGSGARGILMGDTPLNGGQPICRMTFVTRDSKFDVGQRVLTTGLGGTFPPNLLVGTVSDAPPRTNQKNSGLYREGTVIPATDLNDLRELFVLTGAAPAKK
ncbi:MAG: rod shape-determining protein MreC [Verrucomicrobia bacterium]|nr:rod shape-determining protein MreC [Verrucomicrobiota bacterium]NBR62953.1 rod shape-determining protein MreC [Verrucomicrobiota bacterium]